MYMLRGVFEWKILTFFKKKKTQVTLMNYNHSRCRFCIIGVFEHSFKFSSFLIINN